MQERQVQSLGWEDPLEEEMATHSSILAGKSHGQSSLVDYSLGDPATPGMGGFTQGKGEERGRERGTPRFKKPKCSKPRQDGGIKTHWQPPLFGQRAGCWPGMNLLPGSLHMGARQTAWFCNHSLPGCGLYSAWPHSISLPWFPHLSNGLVTVPTSLNCCSGYSVGHLHTSA